MNSRRDERRINTENWLQRLARHDDIMEMQGDLQQLKTEKKGIESGHFSTLRTKITDGECLKKALHSLGITVQTYSEVRGSNGQQVRADVVAVLEGNFDIGWSENSDGTFDLIADLWGVAKKHNQTELMSSILQRYVAMLQRYRRFVS